MWMLVNANGYTLAPDGGNFSALVMDGGQIVAVGATDDVRLQYGARVDRVYDAQGATVLPGFVDSHLHLAWLGMQMNMLDLARATSAEDVLAQVRQRASTLPSGAWVLGANWDENRIANRRMPSIAQLDRAAGGRPVMLRRVCGHVVFGNRYAYEQAGLGIHPANPSDGHFGRTPSGDIDGYAYEGATTLLERGIPAMSGSELERSIAAAIDSALASGITGVHSEDVRHVGSLYRTMDIYHRLQAQGKRLRVHQLVGFDALEEYGEWLVEQANKQPTIEELDWLETGAVKLFADGSLGGRTAFLQHPYHDAPTTRGTAIYTQEELNHRVAQVRKFGLPVAIHAIGDGALEIVLDAIASVPAVAQRDRVIHAEVASEPLIRRMAALCDRMIVDVQPRFAASDLPWVEGRLGLQRMPYVCAWKSMLNAGLYLCGGSDAPVEPIQPLLGIHAAITRRLPGTSGDGRFMNEGLTPYEAVKLFTHGPSYAIHREDRKGTIQSGWMADLTIVDTDISNSQQLEMIPRTCVLQTIVGGEIVYDRLR
ncbi:amidohydrolase [Alicyclobacillus fastidiosus]|uniref:Amidohydrolase n=1 Tax=Alicyclobacillus fastidiosus TaxID=392011 RepID=A0ABY6ZIP8_9BACL|nr:amidohydrolase [Alicyclobacillus fastidiosus]WAH42706.1 amidohydrolase [Alicyclobacillus fastidiosus]GMA64596.1 amidohydrolase [Alicyclobacillus fastidiosus]